MTTLLISDLHLEQERPDITRAFLFFLREQASEAEALYILGDLFEYWIGDDAMTPFHHAIARALREACAHGTRVYLMHGNRDFLLGDRFCREAGCQLLTDTYTVDLEGQRVLLMHGDSLCTGDKAYMRLRFWLRNPLSLWILRRLPLSIRCRLAHRLRQESRIRSRAKPAEIIDVTPEAIPPLMINRSSQTLVHGHTHRPKVHKLRINGRDAQRIVLGDWDRQGWILRVDRCGFHLEALPLLDQAGQPL